MKKLIFFLALSFNVAFLDKEVVLQEKSLPSQEEQVFLTEKKITPEKSLSSNKGKKVVFVVPDLSRLQDEQKRGELSSFLQAVDYYSDDEKRVYDLFTWESNDYLMQKFCDQVTRLEKICEEKINLNDQYVDLHKLNRAQLKTFMGRAVEGLHGPHEPTWRKGFASLTLALMIKDLKSQGALIDVLGMGSQGSQITSAVSRVLEPVSRLTKGYLPILFAMGKLLSSSVPILNLTITAGEVTHAVLKKLQVELIEHFGYDPELWEDIAKFMSIAEYYLPTDSDCPINCLCNIGGSYNAENILPSLETVNKYFNLNFKKSTHERFLRPEYFDDKDLAKKLSNMTVKKMSRLKKASNAKKKKFLFSQELSMKMSDLLELEPKYSYAKIIFPKMVKDSLKVKEKKKSRIDLGKVNRKISGWFMKLKVLQK